MTLFQTRKKCPQVKLWFGYSRRLLELQEDLSAEQHLDPGGLEVKLVQKSGLQLRLAASTRNTTKQLF